LVKNPLAQVIAWYQKRDETAADLQASERGIVVACVLLGAVAGAITAFGSFFYDGGQRVNVLLLLALFAALPVLSMLGFALATCTRDGFAAISTGQFGAIIARLVRVQSLRKIAGLASGDAGPTVAKWLLLSWSQWLGLGYGAGALCVAMTLVLFTDLAFGWSTTLELSTDTVLGATRAVAMPWHGWLPLAAPDEALIKASRYFRLSTNAGIEADPIQLARWWPFVLMSMFCYGLLPRLLTLTVAHWRLRAACAQALLADAHVRRLLQRMNTPLVRTESLQSERPLESSAAETVFADLPAGKDWQVVNWAAVPIAQTALDRLLGDALQAAGARSAHVAGGTRSSAQDSELIAQLADDTRSDNAPAVLIIAKSWEPPTLELMDFIGALRAALADDATVAIMPIAVVDGAPAAPGAAHQLTWQHTLGQAQLPNVHAVALRSAQA
jgi:hypothetical protein